MRRLPPQRTSQQSHERFEIGTPCERSWGPSPIASQDVDPMPAELCPGNHVDSPSLPGPFPRLARSASKDATINRQPGLRQSFRQCFEASTLARTLARELTSVDL